MTLSRSGIDATYQRKINNIIFVIPITRHYCYRAMFFFIASTTENIAKKKIEKARKQINVKKRTIAYWF